MLTRNQIGKNTFFFVVLALLTFVGLSHVSTIHAFQDVAVEPVAAQEDDAKESKKKAKEKSTEKKGFEFSVDYQVDCSPVRKQDKTGTCWCFAGTSFLESELMRRGEGTHDLSEMFIVQNVYMEKAQNFVLRQGKANFSQGALAHDYINAAGRFGLVPEEIYTGRTMGEKAHDHTELEEVVKGMLEGFIKQKKLSPRWRTATSKVLGVYLGESPESFQYQGESFSPVEFAKSLEFDASDYLNFTSYTHHPFYESFVLEIPDNFSNGSFFNVPIEDIVDMIDGALENGYSVAWDGDVSESGFSARKGIAIVPEEMNSKIFNAPTTEKEITQAMRQEVFMSYSTTDDHLMHLVGSARDQNGTKYYLIKNSWGEIGPHRGYLYMSEAYVRLHTVSIMLHKDAVPRQLK